MNHLTLVWANLWRKPVRTILTGLSIVMAFLLIGLLQGVNAGFARSIADARRDVMTVNTRVRGSPALPMSMLEQIKKVPGVVTVTYRGYFIGDFRTPNSIAALAVEPRVFFSLRPKLVVDAASLEAIERARDGMLVTPALMKEYGWKVGDRLTLRSRELQQDGNPDWSFDIVGTFDSLANPAQAYFAIINYPYLDEARITNRSTVDQFFVRIANADRSVATSAAIDALFENSSFPTRTRSDQERAEADTQRLGNLRYFTNAILGAVLFMLLFLTANVTRQSLQERISEFGVLKALGFGSGACVRLALAETLSIYLVAAAIGLGLASLLTPFAREISASLHVSGEVIARGMALAIVLAIASAAVPGWIVYRLPVAAALSGRRT